MSELFGTRTQRGTSDLGMRGLVVTFLVCSARLAHAQATYTLSYTAPAGCPTQSQMLADVAARVNDPKAAPGAQLTLTITGQANAFVGQIHVTSNTGVQGERELTGITCAEVTQGLAFLAALAIDLGGRLEPPAEPEPEPAPEPPPEPIKPVVEPPVPIVVPEPQTPVVATVALGGGTKTGLAPSLSPLATVIVGLEYGLLGARLSLGGATAALQHDDGGADLRVFTLGATGCLGLVRASWAALNSCAGIETGAVQVQGRASAKGRDSTVPWLAARADLELQVPLSHIWFVALEGGAALALLRNEYVVDPYPTLYTAPLLGARAALVVGAKL